MRKSRQVTRGTTIKKLQALLPLDNSNKPIQTFVAENNISLSFLMILLVGQVIILLQDIGQDSGLLG